MIAARSVLHWLWLTGLALLLAGCGGTDQPDREIAVAAPAPPPAEQASPRPSPRVAWLIESLPPLEAPEETEVIEDKTVLALLVPLSGEAASVGRALHDAAVMALFDAYDPRLELIVHDTAGTEAGARRAAASAIEDGADLILGPLFGPAIDAAAPLVRDAGRLMIGFSNDIRVAGEGVYLLSFPPEEQVDRVVRFAAAHGDRVFGALIPETLYGDRVLASLGRAVSAGGGYLASVESYPREREALYDPVRRLADFDRRKRAHEAEMAFLQGLSPDDFAEEIKRDLEARDTLGRLPFDAILLPEGEPLIRSLAPLLPFYDIDPDATRFLGTGLWDGADLGSETALRGAWYAAPEPAPVQAYMDRFETLYGYRPPRLATLGYDVVALAAVLTRDFPGAPFQAERLQNVEGFSGIDGLFRFGEDGVVQRGLAVLEILPDGVGVIDPAAESFFALPARGTGRTAGDIGRAGR